MLPSTLIYYHRRVQVVISSPTVTQKSPDLQIMHNTQRHMGLLPFTIILLIHPTMT